MSKMNQIVLIGTLSLLAWAGVIMVFGGIGTLIKALVVGSSCS